MGWPKTDRSPRARQERPRAGHHQIARRNLAGIRLVGLFEGACHFRAWFVSNSLASTFPIRRGRWEKIEPAFIQRVPFFQGGLQGGRRLSVPSVDSTLDTHPPQVPPWKRGDDPALSHLKRGILNRYTRSPPSSAPTGTIPLERTIEPWATWALHVWCFPSGSSTAFPIRAGLPSPLSSPPA